MADADTMSERVSLGASRNQPPWWPWTRSFIRDFGWRTYINVVVIDGNRHRLIFWAKTLRCWLSGGHRWEERFENVAPEVCFYSTGGYDECRCGRVQNEWGHF